jgi:uncharacterized lipoprotein
MKFFKKQEEKKVCGFCETETEAVNKLEAEIRELKNTSLVRKAHEMDMEFYSHAQHTDRVIRNLEKQLQAKEEMLISRNKTFIEQNSKNAKILEYLDSRKIIDLKELMKEEFL